MIVLLLLVLGLPPVGQWVSCDNYPDLCDFPRGEVGSNPPTNLSDPANIVLTLDNGTIINLSVFSNGTIETIS